MNEGEGDDDGSARLVALGEVGSGRAGGGHHVVTDEAGLCEQEGGAGR